MLRKLPETLKNIWIPIIHLPCYNYHIIMISSYNYLKMTRV